MTTPSRDLTLAWVLASLLRRPRLTFGLPVLVALLAFGASFALTPEYTSKAQFAPEVRNPLAVNPSLLGLASQFGVNLPSQGAQSPQFYAEVLQSREVLEALLETRFPPITSPGDTAPLVDILHINGKTDSRRLESGVKALNKRIAVRVDPRTSIVEVEVDAPGRELARDVAARLLELLNDFNLRRRQTQAGARRRFAEQRLAAADSALRVIEDHMRDFYQANRLWQSSPALTFEEARLRRELALRQELQSMLSREVEAARLDEVNDTPLLTVVDSPSLPQRKSKPLHLLIAIAGFVVGGVFSSAIALGLGTIEQMKEEGHPDYATLRDLPPFRIIEGVWRRRLSGGHREG